MPDYIVLIPDDTQKMIPLSGIIHYSFPLVDNIISVNTFVNKTLCCYNGCSSVTPGLKTKFG